MGDDDFDLFRYADAKAARDEAMSRVEEHATPGWSETMFEIVVEVALRHKQFTSDDVHDLAVKRGVWDGTHDLRALGPVILRAAKAEACVKANIASVPSRRASLHASPRAVWDSLIYEG